MKILQPPRSIHGSARPFSNLLTAPGTVLTFLALLVFVVAGCTTSAPSKPAAATPSASAKPAPAPVPATKWSQGITGTYKGVVGGNSDAIVFTFVQKAGELTATYSIDDATYEPRPYTGKLMKFTETPGKELTLTCRYEDAMNAGSYQISFSKDLQQLTGTYAIDNEGEADENKVTATKQ